MTEITIDWGKGRVQLKKTLTKKGYREDVAEDIVTVVFGEKSKPLRVVIPDRDIEEAQKTLVGSLKKIHAVGGKPSWEERAQEAARHLFWALVAGGLFEVAKIVWHLDAPTPATKSTKDFLHENAHEAIVEEMKSEIAGRFSLPNEIAEDAVRGMLISSQSIVYFYPGVVFGELQVARAFEETAALRVDEIESKVKDRLGEQHLDLLPDRETFETSLAQLFEEGKVRTVVRNGKNYYWLGTARTPML